MESGVGITKLQHRPSHLLHSPACFVAFNAWCCQLGMSGSEVGIQNSCSHSRRCAPGFVYLGWLFSRSEDRRGEHWVLPFLQHQSSRQLAAARLSTVHHLERYPARRHVLAGKVCKERWKILKFQSSSSSTTFLRPSIRLLLNLSSRPLVWGQCALIMRYYFPQGMNSIWC